jgi:hypothetical protein
MKEIASQDEHIALLYKHKELNAEYVEQLESNSRHYKQDYDTIRTVMEDHLKVHHSKDYQEWTLKHSTPR